MKKIITILLVFLMSPSIVSAKEIVKYKWYQEQTIGEYILKGKESDTYENINKSDIIYDEYTELKKVCEVLPHTEVEEVNIYKYENLKQARYMKIYGNSKELILKEITIYIGDKQINGIDNIYDSYLYTGNTVKKYGYILIDLTEYQNIKELQVYISLENYTNTNIYLVLSNNTSFHEHLADITGKTDEIISYNSSWNIYNITDETMYEYEEAQEDSNLVLKEQELWCKTRNIYEYHYNTIRNYYDNEYHEYIEGYIKDEENYIIENIFEEININEKELKEEETTPITNQVLHSIVSTNIEQSKHLQEENDVISYENMELENNNTEVNEVESIKITSQSSIKKNPTIKASNLIMYVAALFIIIISKIAYELHKKSNEKKN